MKYKGTYYFANTAKTKFMAQVNGEIIASAKTEAALKGKITNYLKKQEEALKAAEAEEKASEEAPESAVTVVNDSLLVCVDCVQVIANDDYSGLDYYYNSEEAAKRKQEIDNGIANAGGHIVFTQEDEKGEEFSRQPCECCGSALAGRRNHCAVLSQ